MVVDDEHAPTTNFPNNTLWQVADDDLRQVLLEMNNPEQGGCWDQGDGTPGACPMEQYVDSSSAADGPAIERVTMGVACGRLFGVMAAEKSSVTYLFDMTQIASPVLKKVFHLSEATRTKSPGLAYNDGTIGEIDPENVFFFSADESPSGKPSLLFAGAHSGTFSYWEFDCVQDDDDDDDIVGSNTSPGDHDMKQSSSSWSLASGLLLAQLFSSTIPALLGLLHYY